jgi:hypothetical protein
MKIPLQMHVRHLMNLNENYYQFSKHHLFSFFIFNVIYILVWRMLLAKVLSRPQLIFSFQNLVFRNLFQFSTNKNHLKINISHILNPNLTQINSIKSCSSRSFRQHQRHIPSPPKFSATILI